jgi:hypothetical protein
MGGETSRLPESTVDKLMKTQAADLSAFFESIRCLPTEDGYRKIGGPTTLRSVIACLAGGILAQQP